MQRQPDEPVLWTFRFDPDLRCKHVNFIDRTDGTVRNEDEFLFTPYSAFTVVSVTWNPDPTWMRPHEIVLDVAADNQTMPENLPLAPWC